MNKLDIIKDTWKAVFNEKPETLEINEYNEISVDNFAIVPKDMEIDVRSLLGKETRLAKGWELSGFVSIPPTRHEPEDVQEILIGERERFESIVKLLVETVARDRANQALDLTLMYEDLIDG